MKHNTLGITANFAELDRVVNEYEQEHPLTLEQKYAIFDALYEEAKMFGHFKPENVLDGIEEKIALAKIMNTYVSPVT